MNSQCRQIQGTGVGDGQTNRIVVLIHLFEGIQCRQNRLLNTHHRKYMILVRTAPPLRLRRSSQDQRLYWRSEGGRCDRDSPVEVAHTHSILLEHSMGHGNTIPGGWITMGRKRWKYCNTS